jgi:hypothetical protein
MKETSWLEHAAVHGTMIIKSFLNQSEGINMIHMALDRAQLWAFVNIAVNYV